MNLLATALLAFLSASIAAPRGDGGKEAFDRGMRLYQDKKYTESIAAYEESLAAPDAPQERKNIALYNIACDYALLGDKEKAVEYVVKAIDRGFDQLDHMKSDADLVSVIGDERIAAAVKRVEAGVAEKTAKAAEKLLSKALEKLQDPKGAGFDFDFALTTLDGKPISKKSLAGKVAIVDIWGTWCGPCRKEIPHFVELAEKRAKDPVVIVGLGDEDQKQNKDPEAAAKKETDFAEKHGINYPLALIDAATFQQVPDFKGYPTTLFLDKAGKVRLVEVGYRPLAFIEGVVDALLKESATPQPVDAGTRGKKSD